MNTQEQSDKPLVLITGATGFIGQAVIDRLSPRYRIAALDIKEPESEDSRFSFYACDLTDDEAVTATLAGVAESEGSNIASVLHLAAYYDFSGEPNPLYDELTVQGTKRLLKALQQYSVEQFVFSSSLLVMEPVDEKHEMISEESPLNAEWAYPQSKLKAEKMVREHREDIPAVILRIAGVYSDTCQSLPISQHIRRIYEKQLESVFFPGDPARGQAFIHIDDLVDCFYKTVARRTELDPLELFLIAEPDVLSHQELQDDLGMLIHGKEWPTLRMPKAVAKAGAWTKENVLGQDEFIKPWMIDLADDHYPVDIAHAQTRLDWCPTHHVKATLPSMVSELRKDPERFYREHKMEPPEEFPEAFEGTANNQPPANP